LVRDFAISWQSFVICALGESPDDAGPALRRPDARAHLTFTLAAALTLALGIGVWWVSLRYSRLFWR